jgi:hypothetical protein
MATAYFHRHTIATSEADIRIFENASTNDKE